MKNLNTFIIIWFTLVRNDIFLRTYALEVSNRTVMITSNKNDKGRNLSQDQTEAILVTEDKNKTLPFDEKETHHAISPFIETKLNETVLFDKGFNADAVYRGFYVLLALGCIFIIYIGVKTFRLRRHRASNKYNVIATKREDRESFFPLAAEDGEDEEIFNAATHHGYT